MRYLFCLLIKVLIFPLLILIGDSCKEKEDYEKTATVTLDGADATYDEDASNIKIGVHLDYVRNKNVSIKANLIVKDTATYRDIDYQLTPEAVIKAFSKTGYFQLAVINDKQIDLDDEIEIALSPIQNENIILNSKPELQNYKFIIKNNDLNTTNKLQADLSWRRKNAYDKVNEVNLNLYVQTNVKIENDVITDIGDTYTSSEEFNVFETINLLETDPDQAYFIVVYFNLTFPNDIISYALTLNGFGFTNKSFRKALSDSDLGAAIFYGPFYKSGNRIIGSGRQSENVKEYNLSKEEVIKMGFINR